MEKKIYYKGFEKGLVCRGHQYKEGEWEHIADEAKLCESGAHACEAPLDCFNYYSPDKSEYHEVEMNGVSGCQSDDSKICATDIKVGAKLNIAGIVKAQIKYTKSKVSATSGNWANAATSGNGATSASSGFESSAEVNANDSIAIAWGKDCKAKGIIGSHLVIAERGEWNGKIYPLLGVKMVVVDGESIKADTWYKLVSGKLVEVE